MQCEFIGPITVLTPSGSLLSDSHEGDDLHRVDAELNRIVAEQKSSCLIDLGQVDLISSLGIGIFLDASRKMGVNGQTLSFCNLTKRIESIFVIMKLSLVFAVYQSREKALVAMTSEPKTPP